jgi:hypothetical protein
MHRSEHSQSLASVCPGGRIALFAALLLGSCSTSRPLSLDAARHRLESDGIELPVLQRGLALDDGGGALLMITDRSGEIGWASVERRRPKPLDEELLRVDAEHAIAHQPIPEPEDAPVDVVVTQSTQMELPPIAPPTPAAEGDDAAAARPVREPIPNLADSLHRGTMVQTAWLQLQLDGASPHVLTHDGKTVSRGPTIDPVAVHNALQEQRQPSIEGRDVRILDLACAPEAPLQLVLDVLTIGLDAGLDLLAPHCNAGSVVLDTAAGERLRTAAMRGGGVEHRVAPWPWWTLRARDGEALLAFAANTRIDHVLAVIGELRRHGIWRISFVGRDGTELAKLRAILLFDAGT